MHIMQRDDAVTGNPILFTPPHFAGNLSIDPTPSMTRVAHHHPITATSTVIHKDLAYHRNLDHQWILQHDRIAATNRLATAFGYDSRDRIINFTECDDVRLTIKSHLATLPAQMYVSTGTATIDYAGATTTSTLQVTVNGGDDTFYVLESETINADGNIVRTYRAEINALSKQTLHNQMRQIIKSNLLIRVGGKSEHKKPVQPTLQSNELKARQTLREMLTQSEWRRYLTNGFIMVKAKSGLWYQIFADQQRTRVYHKGEVIESICIHTDTQCPPSDHVINCKVMLEIDEEAFRSGGNVRKLLLTNEKPQADVVKVRTTLLEAYVTQRPKLVA